MMHGTENQNEQGDRTLHTPKGSAPRAPGSEADAPLLRLVGIDKSFPGVHALKNVSLDVYAGEVHVILGQNGAGKVDADQDAVRRLCGRSRLYRDRGPASRRRPPGRCQRAWYRRHLPGILADPVSGHRAEHLSRSRSRIQSLRPRRFRGHACSRTHHPRRSRPRLRHPRIRRRSRRSPAADGGDRQGALAERAGARDGRADGGDLRA